MTRTFLHSFDPATQSPVSGSTVDLDVSEIEDAGIREVLQTPGAAYGAWSILDVLLTPTGSGTPFIFKEPLGQAREVKVALSGLFGRFVARAYLERYFELSIFAHLGNGKLILDRRRTVEIKRLARGDLPDWIACASDLSNLTVAEAKGCHDPGGPARALDRAWAQVHRINVTAGKRKLTVKRIAIATRWGTAATGPTDAHLSVRDPVDEGEQLDPKERDFPFIGLLRVHIAHLIEPLGHAELADALRGLTNHPHLRALQRDTERARKLLDTAPVMEVDNAKDIDGLVGGIVTRAGPITDSNVSAADQEMLGRLNLRPVFVGIERDLIRAAIDGNAQSIRGRLANITNVDEIARPDRAGGWIIPLDGKQRIVGGA